MMGSAQYRYGRRFVSANAGMREIEAMTGVVASSDAPVLIQGETGVGKEMLARTLHERSPRAQGPFIKLNCAALPSGMGDSEACDYARDAFEMADGGTLLLDEIGDLGYKLQAQLLQLLQDHSVYADVRIICSSHDDLESAIHRGAFRPDLYYRLNVISLRIPALRDRKEDIAGLAGVLLRKHAPAGAPLPLVTKSLQRALELHDWPGNVRELENLMRKLLVYRNPEAIAADLRSQAARRMQRIAPDHGVEPILQQVTRAKQHAETETILAALETTRWNRKRAAAVLKIDYQVLLYRMRKLGIAESAVA